MFFCEIQPPGNDTLKSADFFNLAGMHFAEIFTDFDLLSRKSVKTLVHTRFKMLTLTQNCRHNFSLLIFRQANILVQYMCLH